MKSLASFSEFDVLSVLLAYAMLHQSNIRFLAVYLSMNLFIYLFALNWVYDNLEEHSLVERLRLFFVGFTLSMWVVAVGIITSVVMMIVDWKTVSPCFKDSFQETKTQWNNTEVKYLITSKNWSGLRSHLFEIIRHIHFLPPSKEEMYSRKIADILQE